MSDQRERDNFIIEGEIQPDRVENFRLRYLADRDQAQATQTLFEHADAFQQLAEWKDEFAFGATTTLWKGPFVQGSSWAEYSSVWQIAVSLEAHLTERLVALLTDQVAESEVGTDIDALLDEADRLTGELRESGKIPSAIVITGEAPDDFLSAFWTHEGVTPDWDVPELNKLWVAGEYHSLPVLRLREISEARLYVTDLARLATLRKHGDVDFQINEITPERADSILAKNPNIIHAPEGEPNTLDERRRQLLLRVELRLYESFELLPGEPDATLSAEIVA